ncbi:DUF2189 domain-containing protein [uncultured Thiothrix sp.]|uniref:DUF2189 domain-containing protein n=1 Tax=uncultured Thiothrix sp. TaxID=223185 RepID=UPI002619179A|nr:DUF2189 domain-containing protein [uncultured Thiothrix sp.]HMT91684.1 DUF2189 domain-containing protein [Thiolinea sp.]
MEQFISRPTTASPAPHIGDLFKSYPVQQVDASAIPRWLKRGWDDIQANPAASLFYGAVFAIVGIILSMFSAANPAFAVAFTSGFFLVGPFLALGLYVLSWQRDQGKTIDFSASLIAIRHNALGLGLYALTLSFLMVLWVPASAMVIALFFNNIGSISDMTGYAAFWDGLMHMNNSFLFGLSFMGVGFLFALVAFVTGVVTVPTLLERKADLMTAIATSLRVCTTNPKTMFLWALTITVIVGLGLATFNLGLIIAMPLVAHASWHAYRDLIAKDASIR